MTEQKGGSGNHKEQYLQKQIARLREAVAKVQSEQTKAKTRDEEYKQKQLTVNRNVMVFTGLLVLTSLIAGGISLWQGWLTRKIAAAGGEQFRFEHRPYVYVSNLELLDNEKRVPVTDPTVGKPLYVNIYFKNIGKTPAINMVTHRHLLFGNQMTQFRFEPADQHGTIGDSIGPDSGAFITAISTTDTFEVETVNVPAQAIVPWDGTYPIYVFGRFAYDDTFGQHYCTPFSAQFLSGGAWALASELKVNGRSISSESLCPGGGH